MNTAAPFDTQSLPTSDLLASTIRERWVPGLFTLHDVGIPDPDGEQMAGTVKSTIGRLLSSQK